VERRRNIRSLIVAGALLALSAGLVAAHELPGAAGDGLATGSGAAGMTVPVGHGPDTDHAGPVPAADGQEQDQDDDEDQSGGERKANHGWFVSEAAKGDVPDEYDTRGEYVSSVARSGAGKPEQSQQGQDQAAEAPGRTKAAEATSRGGAGNAPD